MLRLFGGGLKMADAEHDDGAKFQPFAAHGAEDVHAVLCGIVGLLSASSAHQVMGNRAGGQFLGDHVAMRLLGVKNRNLSQRLSAFLPGGDAAYGIVDLRLKAFALAKGGFRAGAATGLWLQERDVIVIGGVRGKEVLREIKGVGQDLAAVAVVFSQDGGAACSLDADA